MNCHTQPCPNSKVLYLDHLQDGEKGVIAHNSDRKSAEMGLYPGACVIMFRNRKTERTLVIGAGEARFLISRAIARMIQLLATPASTTSQ